MLNVIAYAKCNLMSKTDYLQTRKVTDLQDCGNSNQEVPSRHFLYHTSTKLK